MDYRTKEFLVAQIRSGTFIEGEIILVPPTVDQLIESYRVYNKSYDEALDSELMTEEDLKHIMETSGLWTNLDEADVKNVEKTIEDIKCDMYNTRLEKAFLKKKRKSLRLVEKQLQILFEKKSGFYAQSCEAFAESERMNWIVSQTAFENDEPYTGDATSIFNKSHLQEYLIREIARTEPWNSYFLIYKNSPDRLFLNKKNQELTFNQRNIFSWSMTYNSLLEAYEPPEDFVVKDDDLLDGWFLYQKRKKEQEKKKDKVDNKMSNVKGDQVFIPINEEEGLTAESIYDMNDANARMLIKERNEYIEKHGETEFQNFPEFEREKVIQAAKAMKRVNSGK
jgi:hypothetical protein